MKKLLGLLSALSVTAFATTSVIACGNEKSDDNNEEQGLTTDEKNQILNQFRAETARLAANHIQGNSSNLYISKNVSNESREFLKYDKLVEKITNKSTEEQKIIFEGNEFNSFKDDIDNLLKINGELQNTVKSVISENTQYQFLLVNVDKILSGFTINESEVYVSTQEYKSSEESESEYVFTISFNLSFNFSYVWNNANETYITEQTSLNFLILPEEVIKAGVSEIVSDLAQTLWKADTEGLFKLDEQKLAPSGQTEGEDIFGSQANSVSTYFSTEEIQGKLSSQVKAAVAEIVPNAEINIDFEYKNTSAETIKRLYTGQMTHTIVTDGYFDQAMFSKDAEATPETMDAAFEKDFQYTYSKSNFFSKQSENILNTFGITLDQESNIEFCEYGELKLQELSLSILGININLNPISLLYVYNPIKSFAQRAAKVFENWRENWGVTSSNDRYALFKLSQSTQAGKAFFSGNTTYPFAFTSGSNVNTYFPAQLYAGTGINKFNITSLNSSRNPYAAFDNNGYSVNYSGFSLSTNDRSWLLVVTIGEVKITINFAKNTDYQANIWYGSGTSNPVKKYVIEKGA